MIHYRYASPLPFGPLLPTSAAGIYIGNIAGRQLPHDLTLMAHHKAQLFDL
jgi:hypothetical protein